MKSFPSALFRFSRMFAFATLLSAGLASAHAQTLRVLHEWSGFREGSEPNALIEGTDGRFYGTTYAGGTYGDGTIFAMNPDGSGFVVLRHINRYTDGLSPHAGLIEGTDGRLYGTTYVGGTYGYGTLFALNTDGSGFTILRHFNGSADGGYLYVGLLEGTDGLLYGKTRMGGTYGYGTLFALSPDGSGFAVLHHFNRSTDGSGSSAGLTEGSDGRLYGTNLEGGTYNFGTLFSLNSDGSDFTVLHHINGSSDGCYPNSGLTEGADGRFYGSTVNGGPLGGGTLFALNPDGSGFTVLHNFDYSTDGSSPIATLIEGADGRLYGSAYQGGLYGDGTLFALNPDGSGFVILRHLTSSDGGYNVYFGMTEGTDGRIYGAAQSGGTYGYGTLFAFNPDGSGFTVLHHLDKAPGVFPRAGLIEGIDGRLYGATTGGGRYESGTIFALNPDGSAFTVLHHLIEYTDGGYPTAALVQDADGRLYGTTCRGGTSSSTGTIFALNPDGSDFTVLRYFDGSTDGNNPTTGLIEGADGRLYGATSAGGYHGSGTLFAVNPDGSEFTVLRHLFGSTDGSSPRASLTEGTDGRLYGTTTQGGDYNRGTLFSLNRNGSEFTVLHHFNHSYDGEFPFYYQAPVLIEGTDGRIYGTTTYGGAYDQGTIFVLNRDGSGFTVLRNLEYSTDGAHPFAGLIEFGDGRLYGTATQGGGFNGTIFSCNRDGSDFTVLHHVDTPTAGLTEGTDGRLYGTTSVGGTSGFGGTIFVLSFVPEITSALTATGQFKRPFSYTITATNDPDDYDALGLPAGLKVNNLTGLISGMPREKGEFAVTIAASNAYGTGVADLSLTIALASPTITRQPQDVTAMANKIASFSVTAKSTSKLSYQWLKDDQPIPGATGHKLMLHKITSDDAGSYRVIVSSSGGSVQSDSAKLTVLPAHKPNSGVAAKAGTGEQR